MSGGRIDYRNEGLELIAESIEFDLANNDHVNSETSDNEVWGLNWKPETLVYVKRMLEDVKSLNRLLHEYDWAVCDDSCEDEFLQEAKAVYGDLTKPVQPVVVPWEESNIGDVVGIDGKRVRINDADTIKGSVCKYCAFNNWESCPCWGDNYSEPQCENHPSGCDVYFTEVEE